MHRAVCPKSGLSVFSGDARSGKSTITVAAAHAAAKTGRPVTLLADAGDRFLADLEAPSDWRMVTTAPWAADWERALDSIDGSGSPIVVSMLTPDNSVPLLNASKRLSVFASLETALVGVDAVYSLTMLGLEQTAIVAALNYIQSQFLVHALCHKCREPHFLDPKAAQEIAPGSTSPMDVWSEVGCPACSGIGTVGRNAVFEMIMIDDMTRDAVAEAVRMCKAPVLPATHYRSMQDIARRHLLQGEVGIGTYRREIATNPLLRATNQLERERAAARATLDMFRRFVGDTVVESAMADDGIFVGARRAEATCMFCDLRGFTTFSEQHEPQTVFRVLNRILDEIIAVTLRHGGMIDKIVGDCVMGLFGLSSEEPDHAVSAATCAIEIQQRLTRLGEENVDIAGLAAGIGINSGDVAVGCLGNAQRIDYTVLGDVVNTAARLQGIAAPGQVLIGSATRLRLGESFAVGDLGLVALKGKASKVQVFELLASSTSENAAAEQARNAAGLER